MLQPLRTKQELQAACPEKDDAGLGHCFLVSGGVGRDHDHPTPAPAQLPASAALVEIIAKILHDNGLVDESVDGVLKFKGDGRMDSEADGPLVATSASDFCPRLRQYFSVTAPKLRLTRSGKRRRATCCWRSDDGVLFYQQFTTEPSPLWCQATRRIRSFAGRVWHQCRHSNGLRVSNAFGWYQRLPWKHA